MKYTIRDNNGNVVFSVECTDPTTPEVSFESINNKLEDLNDYSNKLNKSIEAYNLISDTRAMEALGYVKGAGFKDNIKNVSHEIWKKIGEFCKFIVEKIESIIDIIKQKIVGFEAEVRIKLEVKRFLSKANNRKRITENLNDDDVSNRGIKARSKSILNIYNNQPLKKNIHHVITLQKNTSMYNRDTMFKLISDGLTTAKKISNSIGPAIQHSNKMNNTEYKLDEIEKLQGDAMIKSFNELDAIFDGAKLDTHVKNLEEINKALENEDENVDISVSEFVKELLDYLSDNSNTLENIKKDLNNLNSFKNEIEQFEKALDEFEKAVVVENKKFQESLSGIRKYIVTALKTSIRLISETVKEKTTYIKVLDELHVFKNEENSND